MYCERTNQRYGTLYCTSYQRMPKLILRKLMEGSTTFLNYFPAEQGIQGNMTPSMIVDGKILTAKHSNYNLACMCNCTDPQTTLPNLDQWEQ